MVLLIKDNYYCFSTNHVCKTNVNLEKQTNGKTLFSTNSEFEEEKNVN
jgi:hypothetical protein